MLQAIIIQIIEERVAEVNNLQNLNLEGSSDERICWCKPDMGVRKINADASLHISANETQGLASIGDLI